jgi:hypothetical protein
MHNIEYWRHFLYSMQFSVRRPSRHIYSLSLNSHLTRTVWGFLLLLLCLAIRQHFQGETLVWYCPVTVYPWFNTYSKHSPKLPSPVTAQREKGLSRGRSYDEKEYGYDDYERRPSRNSPLHGERGRTEWNQQRPPARAHTTDRYKEYPTHIHDKFARGASPRR